jgi:hypothetical protein
MTFSIIDYESDVNFSRVNKLEDFLESNSISNARQTNNLICVQLNIRSICKYWDVFHVYFKNSLKCIDILMLCETAIKEDAICLYKIPNYNIYHYCRSDKPGGGIILYVHEKYKFTQKRVITNYFENVFGILELPNKSNISILAVYRPPNLNKQAFLLELTTIFSEHTDINDSILFFGDVNLNLLNECDPIIIAYENLLINNFLVKCVNDVTREAIVGDALTRSCIDHIFVRHINSTSNICACICEYLIADHYTTAVSIQYNCSQNHKNQDINKMKYSTLSQIQIDKNILQYNWNDLLNENDCDILYNKIRNNFENLYKKSQITVCERNKNRPYAIKDWMSRDILEDIKLRDNLYKRWKDTPSNMFYKKEYKKSRNRLNKKINKLKVAFYNDKFKNCFNDTKKTWDECNKILGRKSKTNCDEVINKYFVNETNGLEKISNDFVDYFSSNVFQMLHVCNIRTSGPEPDELPQSIYLPKAKLTEIINIIKQMKNSKTPGIDKIRMYDIKKHADLLGPAITHLINIILRDGKIPSYLKCSVIRPIFKGGDHSILGNYRPISILPSLEKILEKFIFIKLSKYLEKFSIIDFNQYGFQRKKSTESLLQNFTNYINNELNNRNHVLVLFIDYSKAFDTINHTKLLGSLNAIGVRGNLLRFFEDYLNNRTMTVKIDNFQSNEKTIFAGVPQGSILGPILYIIYVSFIKNIFSHVKHYVYADDTALVVSHTDLSKCNELLQEDFLTLQKWCHDAGLLINAKKTKLMHIRSPHARLNFSPVLISHDFNCLHNSIINIQCSCDTIEIINEYVYLGITIDCFFKWDLHIIKTIKRLRSVVGQLYKLKCLIPLPTLRMVYLSLAESLVRYGISAWGHSCKTNISNIQTVQNALVKLIAPKNVYAQRHNTPFLYKSLKILPVKGILWFKITWQHMLDSMYKKKIDHNYFTRFSSNEGLIIPKFQNKYGQRTLDYNIPKIFNMLPKELKNSTKLNRVNLMLRNWLGERNFLY